MKILRLKIKNPIGELVRNIEFSETGISFIYGDIKQPKNLGATINSLGKTLLIKMIDYIYGANEDSNIMKPEIKNYILEACVKKNNKEYKIKRVVGDSSEILIDNKPYSVTEYREFFNIERSLYDKQLLLSKKASELSPRLKNPGKSDNIDFLRMLDLTDLVEVVGEIYDIQENIKQYKKNRKELVSFYGDIDLEQVNEEIYFVDKEVERLDNKLNVISEKIKNIEISDLQKDVINEHSQKSLQLKKLKSKLERFKIERDRLQHFIEDSNKIDITSEHILAIYKKTKQEVPEMVKRKLEEVENFHKKVFEERKFFLNEKKASIEKDILKLEKEIIFISKKVDKLGDIISENQVYQESISLYEKYNTDLQELRYKEGKLSQIKNIEQKIKENDDELINKFELANNIRNKYSELIQKYRDFIYELTKAIYDDNVNSYFNIEIRKKHQTRRPIELSLSLKGDTGEGVGEVKKNLIDYLIFRYNTYLEILIQDSSCYNGIDPRQVSNMLFEVSKIAKKTNKQLIVSVNKYQLGEYKRTIRFVEKNSSIILSESDKLLKFDF